MKRDIEISIVVPAYNEEQLIGNFLTAVDSTCKKLGASYEMIIIENGSTDATWEIIQEKKASLPSLTTYRLPTPSYGEAIFQGISKSRGTYIVIFNVDFWDDVLLRLPKVDLLGYDIVIGSKLLPGSVDTWRFNRRLITWIFSKLLKIFFHYKGTDTHGVKIMRRTTLMPIIAACKTRSGIFDSEFMIRASRKKLRILELPVRVEDIRPVRFSIWRVFQTPADIWNLYKALW